MMVRVSESEHLEVRVKAAALRVPVSRVVRELLAFWVTGGVRLPCEPDLGLSGHSGASGPYVVGEELPVPAAAVAGQGRVVVPRRKSKSRRRH